MKKLNKIIEYAVHIEVLTGLHIGGSQEKVEIGGLDNPVIRAVMKDNTPYIPGSSLKGKIRSLLEQALGIDCLNSKSSKETDKGDNKNEEEENKEEKHNPKICPICKAFGSSQSDDNNYNHRSRLIFRDLYLTEESKKKLEELDTDYPYTEIKHETAIDRITGKAKRGSLRETERVPAGTHFEGTLVVQVFSDDDKTDSELSEGELLKMLKDGVELLNRDYLGGSGSRGYGHVKVELKKVKVLEVKVEDQRVKLEEVNSD